MERPEAAATAPAAASDPLSMLVFLDERYKHARRVDGGASKGGGVYVQTLCDVAKQHLAARGCRVHPLFACADVRCAACDKSARRTAPPAGTITLAVVVSGPGDEHAAEEARSALHRLASEHAGVRLSERLRLVGVGWVNAGCEESLLGEHLVADEDASQRTPTASAGKKRARSEQPPASDALRGGGGAPAATHPFFSLARRSHQDDPPPSGLAAGRTPALSSGAPRAAHNAHLADPLDELSVVYKKAPQEASDQFRSVALGKAAKLLRAWPDEITGPRDYEAFLARVERQAADARARAKARSDKGWTSRAPSAVLSTKGSVAAVIRQMASAPPGRERAQCERLQALLSNERVRAMLTFSTIHGVGPVTAGHLYEKGLRTLDNLRGDAGAMASLTPQQRIGLRYVDDFAQRIPRAAVEDVAARVRGALVALYGAEQICFCEPVGSYRRGRPASGDVDMLICVGGEGKGRPGQASGSLGAGGSVLIRLVRSLTEVGFITESLTAVDKGSAGKETFMGVCRLEPGGVSRRLDMKVYPRALLPYALLYFTGSDYFNRSMRHYAKLQGYRLSDNGLEDKTRRPLLPPCHTEADVFARLGLAWREPYDRELPVTPAVAEVGGIDEFGLLVHDEESSPHGRGGEAFAGVDAEDETAITAMLLRQ